MEGVFNEPQIFIKFYDHANNCKGKCMVCGPEYTIPGKNILYAASLETVRKAKTLHKKKVILKNIINYPNGEAAFIMFSY